MYEYIQGPLIQAAGVQAIIDVNGLGYKILIPSHLSGQLPQIGQEVRLYISFVVREFSHALYGFLSPQERDLFETFMNVSGVGPKLALSIIGHLSFNELHAAVGNQNIAALCKVPGIGKKTAERLIIELRDKLTGFLPAPFSELPLPVNADPQNQKIHDAMSALINLGYTQIIAQKAIKNTLKDVPENIDLAELITLALKYV